jgi:hypothetical protein
LQSTNCFISRKCPSPWAEVTFDAFSQAEQRWVVFEVLPTALFKGRRKRKMLLREFFLNGINTKERTRSLTDERKRRLFEFDHSAGYKGDFSTWKESLSCPSDLKAEERYRQAVAAGTRLSFDEYRKRVLKK